MAAPLLLKRTAVSQRIQCVISQDLTGKTIEASAFVDEHNENPIALNVGNSGVVMGNADQGQFYLVFTQAQIDALFPAGSAYHRVVTIHVWVWSSDQSLYAQGILYAQVML